MTTQSNRLLEEEDDGKTIETHVGDALDLILHENATTGYRWAIEGHDTKMIDVEEVPHFEPSKAPGSGGVNKWEMKAIAPGTTEVRLKSAAESNNDRRPRLGFRSMPVDRKSS
jgi:inhibitor of cysteine peptidase